MDFPNLPSARQSLGPHTLIFGWWPLLMQYSGGSTLFHHFVPFRRHHSAFYIPLLVCLVLPCDSSNSCVLSFMPYLSDPWSSTPQNTTSRTLKDLAPCLLPTIFFLTKKRKQIIFFSSLSFLCLGLVCYDKGSASLGLPDAYTTMYFPTNVLS